MEMSHELMCENVRKLDESVAMKANKDAFMISKHENMATFVTKTEQNANLTTHKELFKYIDNVKLEQETSINNFFNT